MNQFLRSPVFARTLLFMDATSPLASSPDKSSDHSPGSIPVTQAARPRPIFNFGGTGKAEVRIHNSNDPRPEKSVIDAIEHGRFSPALKHGRVAAIHARQSFSFEDSFVTPQSRRALPAPSPDQEP